MTKEVESLNTALEELHKAFLSVNKAIEALPHCGAFSLMENHVVSIRSSLCHLTEIASALIDVKMRMQEEG